ncbi:jhy protein homolog [Spea bombifrons]|uniref:jhy protein homolog n=1 Tax=Spea bombifrons TaxID=233779 RepID=UPI002349CF90|nr:jhy protein homolog [Spea bombifrons]
METSSRDNYGEFDLNLSLDSLEDSDSLTQETRYQSELKDWISDQEHLVRQTSERSANGDGERDYGAKQDDPLLGVNIENVALSGNISSPEGDTGYSDLRYDPNWKSKQKPADEDDVSSLSSGSEDYRPPEVAPPATAEKNVKVASKPAANRANARHGKRRLSENPAGLSRASGDTRNAQKEKLPQKDKPPQKDFVAKNRLSLGARQPKQHSYLHIHRKKADETSADTDSVKTTLRDPPEEQKPEAKNEGAGKRGESDPKKSIMASDGSAPRTRYSQNKADFAPGLPRDELPEAASAVTSTAGIIQPPGDFRGFKLNSGDRPPSFQRVNEERYLSKRNGDPLRTAPDGDPRGSGEFQIHRPNPVPHLFSTERGEVGSLGLSEEQLILQGHFLVDRSEFPFTPFSGELQPTSAPEENSETGSDASSEPRQRRRDRNHPADGAQRKRSIHFLKQEVKLGGIGPNYKVSKEKEEQLRQQKEYAKLIHERNKNSIIPRLPEIPVQSKERNKCPREKGLEYAKNVPKPQSSPKSSNQTVTEVNPQLPVYPENFSPQLKLLQDLQLRHEREKAAVAALSALHII